MDVNRSTRMNPMYDQPHQDAPEKGSSTSETHHASAGAVSDAGGDREIPSRHSAVPTKGAGMASRPRSLSETRMQAQLSSSDDEKVLSMKDFDRSLENFGEFFASHTLSLHSELNSMKGTVEDLSKSLSAAQNQKTKLESKIAERREGAKNRAISRENAIKELQEENQGLNLYKNQSDKLMTQLQEAVESMESKLGKLNEELSQKSKVISSQANAIKKIKEGSKEVKSSHYDELEEKDRSIVNVKQQLENLKSELDEEKQKNAVLQKQLDGINTAEKQFTTAKSDALVKTGKQISDQSEVLQKLNSKLLDERKVMLAQNKENKEEIAQLKGRLVQLARLAGIELPADA